MTAAERLAEFAISLRFEDVPETVRQAAKLHLLDTLGCGLAAHALGVAAEGREAMAELGGEPQATVIGLEAGLPAPNAAFANAMLCHGLDFDDTHSDSVSHVTVVTGPAALAAGEAQGARAGRSLAAVVGANEVVTRIGMAASGGSTHAASTRPRSAGSSARRPPPHASSASTRRRRRARSGSPARMASGIFAYLEDGTPTKPLHPAWAAHGGLLAARLASLGAAGPPSVLEGKFGLYHAFLGAEQGEIDLEPQLADLGSRWETPRIAYKPYPACHFMHGSLGATAEAAGRLLATTIEEVVVTVPAAGVPLVLEPAEAKLRPPLGLRGQVLASSTRRPRCSSTAASASTTYTDEAIARPGRARARAQGALRDEGVPDRTRRRSPAASGSDLRDGRTLEAEFPHQKGGPENPLSADEVREKFRGNASLALDRRPRSRRSRRRSSTLEEHDDLSAALAPLAADRCPRTEFPRPPATWPPPWSPPRAARDRRHDPRVRRARRHARRLRARARRRVPGRRSSRR